jgi:arylsulfatase A-like enzyme
MSVRRGQRPQDIVWLGAWLGLATGFGAVSANLAMWAYARTHTNPMGLDAGWLNAPLADGLLFAIVGLVAYAGMWLSPRWVSKRTAFFCVFALGFLSLLLLIPALSPYSSVLLACGLAFQASRAATSSRVLQFCRSTTPVLFVAALAMSLTASEAPDMSESRARAAAPPPAANAPNVFLIVLDTVRARSLSVYGHTKPTSPWLERFAASGVLFQHALSTGPWTLPTHAALFTGHLPTELSTDWEASLDNRFETLAEVFSARGYLTAAFVANYDGAGARTGLDRGFHRYDDHNWSKAVAGHNYPGKVRTSSALGRLAPSRIRMILDSLANKNAADVNRAVLTWLGDRPERPVFAFLNYFDAHTPYRCPGTFDEMFNSGDRRRRRLDRYESCTAYIDDQLRQLFDELDNRGFLKNSLVVITSDHGEHFGEHGLFGHGHSLYRELLEVPLIIASSDATPRGLKVPDLVSLVDVAPTILELAGAEPVSGMTGRSLARFWSPNRQGIEKDDRDIVSSVTMAIRQPGWLNSDGPMVSLVQNGLHYIKNFGRNQEELYDFAGDPRETDNLAQSAIGEKWLPYFRSRIEPATVAGTLSEVSR